MSIAPHVLDKLKEIPTRKKLRTDFKIVKQERPVFVPSEKNYTPKHSMRSQDKLLARMTPRDLPTDTSTEPSTADTPTSGYYDTDEDDVMNKIFSH